MPDFSTSKADLRTAAAATETARDALMADQARLHGMERDLERRARDLAVDDPALAALHTQREAARADVDARRATLDQSRAAQAASAAAFAAFADPVTGVERLADDAPIALFPLRLETRYRRVAKGDGEHHQLCVRVYPDDVLVDSFQAELSAAERANTVTYWTERWRGAGAREAHRAAFVKLAAAHGAGRAHWLIGRYAPSNLAQEPAGGGPVLVVRPPAPLPASELQPIRAFWTSLWTGGPSARDAAFAALTGVVGAARAAQVESDLVPAGFADPPAAGAPGGTPTVAFLDMPDPATLVTTRDDWTRAARAPLLPERLVLIGRQGGGETVRLVGKPIPGDLQVGPDPSAAATEQLTADGVEVQLPAALRWTVDFDAAVAVGMGFVVDLTEAGLAPAFEQLFVLGVRIGSDRNEGAAELSTLLTHHQASRRGLALLAQGTPTNNTDDARAAYSWWEDKDAAFDHFFPAAPPDALVAAQRSDGAWLAGLLGITAETLAASPGSRGLDQAEARAMNRALWPATLGYWMEQLMEPVFADDTVAATRSFFCDHVIGRGPLPLIRIGAQPYGIVTATAWSRADWWNDAEYPGAKLGLPDADYLTGMRALIDKAEAVWSPLAAEVAHVGTPGPDPQATLLDILGLHPGSVEFHQRYAQNYAQYHNLFSLQQTPAADAMEALKVAVVKGLIALKQFGWAPGPRGELPALLTKVFHAHANLLKGDVVAPTLSEAAGLPVERADGRNYVAWIAAAARTSHDALRRQAGFVHGPPAALLYLLLHHATDLGYVDAGMRLLQDALGWTAGELRLRRREQTTLDISPDELRRGRWEPLYRPEAAVTGNATQRLGDFIPGQLSGPSRRLGEQLAALDLLARAPTARLERALVEHLDCLSYRLDAWRTGFQSVQLAHMRAVSPDGFARDGILIGAYGLVENLAPRGGTLAPVTLDPELAAVFDQPDAPPPVRDSENFGHIHAPSLDHAVTAAILRNGYLSHATPEHPHLLAIDLSSQRVRIAQRIVEGIRNGQSLGALLGYRLERALHDEPDLYLDRLIYALRAAFPLAGNRNLMTRVSPLKSITAVEARNVIDGAELAAHIAATGKTAYPYGVDALPPLQMFASATMPAATVGALIDAHIAAMRSVGDAVADLGVAEGVFQVVRGNHERAAGALDAVSKGAAMPDFQVARTPRTGRSMTHRLALHLSTASAPGQATPRTVGEPALAAWIAERLPSMASIVARVRWRDRTGASTDLTPSMADLGLAAIDVFYLLDAGGARSMAGFDELLIGFAERGNPPPPGDAVYELEYFPEGAAGITLFELAPLVRALRGAVLGAKPLHASDLTLPGEAARSDDADLIGRPDKVENVRDMLDDLLTPAAQLATVIGDALDPAAPPAATRAGIDGWLTAFRALSAGVAPFGTKTANLYPILDARRGAFRTILARLDEIARRWTDRAAEFDTHMAAYAALPPTTSLAARHAALIVAGRTVSTKVVDPLPATAAAHEALVAQSRAAFDAARATLDTLSASATTLGTLITDTQAFQSQVAAVDATPTRFDDLDGGVVALARRIGAAATALHQDIAGRLARCDAALVAADAATGDKAANAVQDAARALLGEAFIVLPEFIPAPARRAEWERAWMDRQALISHLQDGPDSSPSPLDDWLNGIGRVRERPRHLEAAAVFADTLDVAAPLALDAVQLPYRADDVWLGARFPATFRDGAPFVFEGDKLLYTAHFAAGAAPDQLAPQAAMCGLLIDEWSETVPARTETTGLAFHYDRPNCEAPQAILLVTPPKQTGHWLWTDIVDAVRETIALARLRAVEPDRIDQTVLGPLLPATIAAVAVHPVTPAMNLSFNNRVDIALAEAQP